MEMEMMGVDDDFQKQEVDKYEEDKKNFSAKD